jgi:glycosyltransferase involved in cell wall biosynthesis
VPVVATVHDVSFVEHPEYFAPARAAQLRWTVRRTVERAARVVTVSEFSRRAIARAYGLDAANIVVTPDAAAPLFRPLPKEAASAWVRRRFAIASPFLLTVGDLQPRKNHLGLIRAFSELLRGNRQWPHRLVLAGKAETLYARRVRKAAERSGVADRIHFTGFVSDDELLRLYNACEFFVFPSFYEGFGLPVVEAMACARAVACSETSAVGEVADAAAVLFKPDSTREMVRALRDLILGAELRSRMERLGLQRSTRFSWRDTARRTLELYYEVAGGHTRARDRSVPAVRS